MIGLFPSMINIKSTNVMPFGTKKKNIRRKCICDNTKIFEKFPDLRLITNDPLMTL